MSEKNNILVRSKYVVIDEEEEDEVQEVIVIDSDSDTDMTDDFLPTDKFAQIDMIGDYILEAEHTIIHGILLFELILRF